MKSAYFRIHQLVEEMNLPEVSIVINNAGTSCCRRDSFLGIVYKDSILSLDMDEVENTFTTNVSSQLNVIRTFIPDLLNQQVANIVNISSLISRIPSAYLLSYAASKAAVHAFSNCLRVEFKSNDMDHIRVCTIHPQFVETGMFKGCLSEPYAFCNILME